MRLLLLPGGILLAVLVWVFMVFSNYVVIDIVILNGLWKVTEYSVMLRNLVLFCVIFYEIVLVFAWIAHVVAVFSDPGSTKCAPFVSPDLKLYPTTCEKCEGRWKPPRAHHCRSCQECIFRMDHHCPWINNCVALGNQKCFILFLMYTGIACLMNLCFLAVALYVYIFAPKCIVSFVGVGFMVCDFAICSFFLYMTMEFLFEQWEALETNSTLIENYRKQRGRKTNIWKYLEEVFGKQWLFWCIPFPATLFPEYTEPVFSENYFDDRADDYRHDQDASAVLEQDSCGSVDRHHHLENNLSSGVVSEAKPLDSNTANNSNTRKRNTRAL